MKELSEDTDSLSISEVSDDSLVRDLEEGGAQSPFVDAVTHQLLAEHRTRTGVPPRNETIICAMSLTLGTSASESNLPSRAWPISSVFASPFSTL